MITKTVRNKKVLRAEVVYNPKYILDYLRALILEGNFKIVSQSDKEITAKLEGLSLNIHCEVSTVSVLGCDSVIVDLTMTLRFGLHTTRIVSEYSAGDFSVFFVSIGDHLFECSRTLLRGEVVGTQGQGGCLESDWRYETRTVTI